MSDRIRILHVDDEPDLADMTATFLEREDDTFEVETATRSSTGLDRLTNHDFDCIVADYDMPGQTGIEFLKTVREDYPDLPFILYTGKGSEEVASDAISAGVTDYLQKESGTSQYTVLAHRIRNAVEQYRSQQAVEDTEEKLSQLADRSEDILFMVDGDWSELLFINSAFEDIWGIPTERLEENLRAFLEHIHPEDRDRARRSMERLSNGQADELEYRVVPPDGDQRWVRAQSKPIFDDGDTVARIAGFVRDVTERKERARRFEAIFNNTYTFAGLLEPDGTLIEANETALSFGGLDRDDVVGKPLWETDWVQVSEETRRTVREGVERARNGELFRDEIRVQGSDREAVIDFSIRPITNEQGEVTLLVPEGRDITERKGHEQKRQQIIDRVTDAIVEVDADWTITLVNDQAEELYDMDKEFLLGRDFWDVFSEAVGTRFEEVYREAMETREPTSFVEHYAGLGGWFDIEVFPEDNGGLAFYFQEVTERIQRSRELEQTRELLDHTERIADVGGWEIDTETHEVFWTDNLFDLLGVDYDEEPPLEEALDIYVEEDRPLVENAVEEAMRAGDSFDVDARFQHPDGDIRWLQMRGQPTLEDGEVVTLRGAVQDITERKQRERTLEQTEARFRALAENFPNGAVHYFDRETSAYPRLQAGVERHLVRLSR
jgi:PAS domain S-box-containing protein